VAQDRLPRALTAQQPAVGRHYNRGFSHDKIIARSVVLS
jgi:hypothetical protein